MAYAFIIACALLATIPVIFVWNEVYQDGIVGRLALIGISVAATVTLMKLLTQQIPPPTRETMVLVISFAAFLTWHLWRFHSRVLTNKKAAQGQIERRTHAGGHEGA